MGIGSKGKKVAGIKETNMSKFTSEEITKGLKDLPGWQLADSAIKKQYAFPAFMDGIRFVDRVAQLAEMADHHPDILINYKRVTMMLSTHSEGGVTQKDFDLAHEIEKAATRLAK
jgi:4a-hydroxytetrahydrobiopterin dehydratase